MNKKGKKLIALLITALLVAILFVMPFSVIRHNAHCHEKDNDCALCLCLALISSYLHFILFCALLLCIIAQSKIVLGKAVKVATEAYLIKNKIRLND